MKSNNYLFVVVTPPGSTNTNTTFSIIDLANLTTIQESYLGQKY